MTTSTRTYTTLWETIEVRLRQKGDACFMTLKSGAGLQRSEYEIMIDRSQFDVLWPATVGRRIEKTRYQGSLGDQRVFELDVFSGDLAPLTLVEVEFTSVEAAADFVPPAWFGMDVTDDKRFKNRALATELCPKVGDGLIRPSPTFGHSSEEMDDQLTGRRGMKSGDSGCRPTIVPPSLWVRTPGATSD